jgi:hypothetical protein
VGASDLQASPSFEGNRGLWVLYIKNFSGKRSRTYVLKVCPPHTRIPIRMTGRFFAKQQHCQGKHPAPSAATSCRVEPYREQSGGRCLGSSWGGVSDQSLLNKRSRRMQEIKRALSGEWDQEGGDGRSWNRGRSSMTRSSPPRSGRPMRRARAIATSGTWSDGSGSPGGRRKALDPVVLAGTGPPPRHDDQRISRHAWRTHGRPFRRLGDSFPVDQATRGALDGPAEGQSGRWEERISLE